MAEPIMDLADSFERHLKAEGKAELTLRVYLEAIRFYSEWLEQNGHDTTLDELSRPLIREWLAYLSGVRKRNTLRTRHAGLLRFCLWLVNEGELAENPMKGMAAPKIEAPPVPVLEDEELRLLLKACAGRDFVSRRDEAMVRLLLDAGVRISELCELTIDNLNLKQETAIVRGKGGKVRAVYFGVRTSAALDRYLRERKKHRWCHLDAVFLTQRGALSPAGARERLEVLTAKAGLENRVHPHRFRHTFAHDFLLNGGQERDLKRLAGWSSDTMLERYGSSAADARAREATRRLRRGDRV